MATVTCCSLLYLYYSTQITDVNRLIQRIKRLIGPILSKDLAAPCQKSSLGLGNTFLDYVPWPALS